MVFCLLKLDSCMALSVSKDWRVHTTVLRAEPQHKDEQRTPRDIHMQSLLLRQDLS